MLGFVVISGIGVMLAGLALGDAAGLSGAILYAVHSMLVMTALYLLAGMIRDAGGSFSLDDLAGLYDRAPLLAGVGAAARLRHRRPAARFRPVAEGDAGQGLARCRPGLARRGNPGQRLADHGRLRPRLPAGLLARRAARRERRDRKGRAPGVAYAGAADPAAVCRWRSGSIPSRSSPPRRARRPG